MGEIFNDELVIEAGHSEKNYWRDIWRYRELFYILSWRDLKVRYKQTIIGGAWSIIRPLLTTIIFTIVFNKVAKLQAASASPYALMVFAGMLPWQFFSNSLSEASNSLIGNSNLISKVYFPRMIVPASSVITSMVDFAISFLILIAMFIWYRYLPSINIIFLPLFILVAFIAAFGIGLYITALNVKYRDFRYIIPFIVQFGLYITPVGFSSSIIPGKWRLIYYLNPMVGVIDGFRWSILGDPIYFKGFIISVTVALAFLWIGISYFRKTEKSFADNI
ncbi:ABC transporter permease [Flavihumibacter profundi]|uniref:ABC transporter permease n=1 Tax=Flavihumibacter profundi TaxID=2716883 RepID=UPI001CC7AF94|nr:ABC transporter permease [Flavihumibacter profundi]MBZ5857985.1 ABC transporter permease [Flavihumibacter profundi]